MTTFIETLNLWGDYFLKFAWPVLWQSSLLIAIIFVLEFALRRKIRAAIRYALWLVVLVKLLLPPSLALPTSPTWWIHPAPAPLPVKAPPVSFTVSYGEQMAPDFPLPPSPVIPPPRTPAMSFAAWALAASGVVSAGLLAWLLVRWRQINQKVRHAKTSEELIPVLDEARRLTCLRLGIRLKLTEDSMSPAVCGLFRPVILLPQSLVERLSDGQLRAVLLHEAIHLRRGDVWVNCAQALLQIVYWWHPLLWLANARIRRVREEAVDDAVMLALRDDAEIYAPTLLEVAKLAFNRPLASLGLVGILESRSALRQRIERLVNFNAPKKAGLTVVSILGILAFSAVALPMGEAPEKTNAPALPSSSGDSNQTNSRVATADNHSNGADDAQSQVTKVFQINQPMKAGDLKKHLLDAGVEIPPTVFVYADGGIIVMRGSEEQLALVEQAVQKLNAFSLKADIGLPGREAAYQKLNSIRLESVPWSGGVTLNEALRFLHEQSILHDPDKKGIQFLFNPNVDAGTTATNAANETVDASSINVKLVLDDVSLHEVLDAVMLVADRPIRYTVKNYAVVISPKPSGTEPPTFEMRVFKIDTNTFTSGNLIQFISGSHFTLETNSIPAMAKSFFGLTASGRSVAFNDRLGLLFIKATAEELDNIERVIQKLNQFNPQMLNQITPQVHIKARFIEVPEGQVDAILKAGTAVDTKQTNVVEIIAADKMKSLLHQLESVGGVEVLAEPEAVTTSRRQVQIRSRVSTVDLAPILLADGYSVDLTLITKILEFLRYDTVVPGFTPPMSTTSGGVSTLPTVLPHFASHSFATTVTIWDNQTVVLDDGDAPSINTTKNRLLIFVTTTIVDPAGNRVHSDDELRQMQEEAKSDIPPQHTSILVDTNFQARVHALGQRTGVETLAEPKAVVTSGRQTQPQNANVDESTDYSPAAQNDASSTMTFKINQPMNAGRLEKSLLDGGVKIPPTTYFYANDSSILLVRGTKEQMALVYRVVLKLNGISPKEAEQIVNDFVKGWPTSAGENLAATNLELRVFKVDPNTFVAAFREIPGVQTNNVPKMAKSLFSKLGVDLTAPGKSIAFDDRLGFLFVKATPSELDTIEHVIQAMNQVAPQIHIKARFIEVPKEGFVALPQLSSNVVAGQMTGILSNPEFRTVLQALEQHQGVETLALPECVTTSGRQTQMRAPDINWGFRETSSNSTSVVTQTGKVEIGPTVDLVPYVLADGYTINLTAKADVLEFLGYDSATDRTYATNNIGRISSAPTVRPGFRIHEGQATVNLWDNQTLVLGNLKSNFIGGDGQIGNETQFFQDEEKKKGTADTELLVFITATIVDPAGNRVHSDDEMRQIQERTKSYAPSQPNISTPSR